MPEGLERLNKHCQDNFIDYHLSAHIIDNIVYKSDRSHNYIESEVKRCISRIGKGEVFEAFEIELSKSYRDFGRPGWFLTKYCIRIQLSPSEDLVVVIRPSYNEEGKIEPENNKIVTAWINARDDAHYTLDGSKYTSKERWIDVNKKRR